MWQTDDGANDDAIKHNVMQPHLESLAFKVWISKESSDDNLM